MKSWPYDPHSHSVEAHELRQDTTSSCEACHFLLLQGSRVSGARGIKAETYTEELAKKTEGYGDCCMMSICEWGRARLEFEEDINDFDDQDHMDYVGEFNFSVNETFWSCDHNIFMVAPAYTDAHNQLLVHLKPSDMGWEEKHSYVLPPKKIQCKERRRDIQKQNKRKGQGFGDGPLLDSSWDNWDGRSTWAQDSNTGYGGSSSSSTRPWRPKITRWFCFVQFFCQLICYCTKMVHTLTAER